MLDDFYHQSVEHRRIHKCGGMPFESGFFLRDIALATHSTTILEIGTAIGYSSACFALANENIRIDTVDKNSDHESLAQEQWSIHNVSHQITFHLGDAREVLPTLDKTYDLIFFDGYAPLPELVHQYVRLGGKDTLVLSSNLELPSEHITTPEYLHELSSAGFITTQRDDMAFSSRSEATLKHCVEMWDILPSIS